MPETYLSVIVPAFNEEKRIGATIFDIDKHLSRQKYSYEIIVASDGSTDKTVDVVKKYKQLIKNLEVIDNLENKGKGMVVRQGMLAGKGKYRVFMDADNSASIKHFDNMEHLFKNEYDIVIGTRDKRDSKEARQEQGQPFFRRIPDWASSILTWILVAPGAWDTQCGFKGFSEKAVNDIFPRLKIPRWGFDVEILCLARRLGYKVGIIPIHWKNDRISHVTLGGYLNTLMELFLIKWNVLKDRYGIKEKK